MDLSGTRTIAASPQAVWDTLRNPSALQKAIPGAEEVTWLDDNTMKVRLNVGVGPLKGTGTLRIQVAEATPPSHMKLVVNRNDERSSVDGSLIVDLAADGGGTKLTYKGAVTLGGMLAAMDNPLTGPIVGQQVNHFFDKLAQEAK